MLHKKLGSPLGGRQCKKTQGSQRLGEGRIYYSQQVWRTLGIFLKAVYRQQKWGNVKVTVHAYSWRGLRRGEFSIESRQRLTVVQALVDWSHEGQERSNGGWGFRQIFTIETVFIADVLSLPLLLLLPDNSPAFFCFLKIINYWDIPGGPVAKSVLPMQGAQVQSLARELESTCHN